MSEGFQVCGGVGLADTAECGADDDEGHHNPRRESYDFDIDFHICAGD